MHPHTHTRHLRRAPRRLVRHSLPLALAAALATPLVVNAQELPSGGTVVDGSATITLPGGATMNINQGSQGAIINWGSFSIGAGGTVNIVQPNATSVILNRVIGTPGSLINGSLNANGRVFIVNPNGVLFGAGSQVNVGGLVASTLQISNEDFNAGVASGRFVFNAASPGAGSVDNFGALVANNQGTIALLAGAVQNGATGTIRADDGTVALASSQQVTLDFFGDGLTQVTIGLGTDDGFITNAGLLQADGGSVQLRTQTDDGQPGGFGGFIEHTGIIRARSLANRNGRVVLDAGAGEVRIGFISDRTTGATIDASGTAAGQTGGVIEIRGESVEIEGETSADVTCADADNACTRIDASGHSGGGTIAIASSTNLTVRADSDEGPASDDSVTIVSDALAAGSGGTITLGNAGNESEAGAPGGTSIAGAALVSARGLGTASGGEIAISNDDGAIEVRPDVFETFSGTADFIADGASAGGSVVFDAGTALNFLPPASTDLFTLSADATGSGVGGLVRTAAGDILDLRGIEVSAGGPAGAGAWEIQSGRGLAVVDGFAEFGTPDSVSLVSDDSIGGALSAGTDVDITVPAPATGTAQINIAPGVAIANTGTLPVALSLTAPGGQVLAGVNPDDTLGAWSIGSSAGPLDLSIDALSSVGLFLGTVQTGGGAIEAISRNSSTFGIEVNATTLDSGGGDVSLTSLISADIGVTASGATINTDGGALTLQALDSGGSGVSIDDSTLDTRVAQNAANPGGAATIEGNSRGESGTDTGVVLSFSRLFGSTGNIAITGRTAGTFGGETAGVSVSGGGILSTSGAIDIFGAVLDAAGTGVALSFGSLSSGTGAIGILGIGGMTGGAVVDGSGILAAGYDISSNSGNIVLSGHGAVDGVDDSGNPILNDGLGLGSGTDIASNGGDVFLSGSSDGSGAGIFVSGGGASVPDASVDAGGGNIVLRAGNDGSTPALQIDGSVSTAGVVDVRAGEVTAAGAVLDRTASTLQIGGGAGQFVSMNSVANIDTPDLVFGHAGHAGAITLAQALTRAGNVSLQNTGGAGGIALNAALNLGSGTLALISGGDITQTAAGGITAQSLLARSTGGSVDLTAGQNNVSGSTLAGGAADGFGYIDVDALAIGDVAARGFDAAGQAATTLAESGVDAADAVFVRNNAGDLTLGADVSGTDVDLVTAGRLQNVASASISAGNRWRVWADTFVGEQRGGLAGTGPLPNLYNCSFGGPCGVTVPADGDHFIYREQPTATIDIASFTREYGLANPALLFTVSGLILGDQAGNAILGAPSTTAVLGSDVGTYPITGSFTSPAGYAIQVDPGAAGITPATLTLIADPFSRVYGDPNSALTGDAVGFRAGDTLADLLGTLTFTTDATQGSDVGSYGIFGNGVSALNYNIVNASANATALTITPATLTYVADPFTHFFGQLLGPFTGTVAGFRNGDTVAGDTTGTLQFLADAAPGSPAGVYPIFGTGLQALNYEFAQDPANLTALRINFAPIATSFDLVRESTDTYLYDRNIGTVQVCLLTDLLGDRREQDGDVLAREWSKVRSRPNLTSCVRTDRKNGCDDF